MAKKIWTPVIAGVSALALVGGVGVASALDKDDVTMVVDGVAKTIAVRENTVAKVLELEGIEPGPHDVVLPALETTVVDGLEISIAYARPLDVTIDGEQREVWTTAKNVGDALKMLRLDAADSKLSASRSAAIGREGLSVDILTARDLTVTVAGVAQPVRLAGTVADALAEVGVTPDADDKVTPSPETALEDGMSVVFVRVDVKPSTKKVAVAFEKTTTESSKMLKGEKEVTTKGVVGENLETYTNVYEDGVLKSSALVSTEVVKAPVNQVTTVGTKVPPPPAPEPEAAPAERSESASSGGSGLDLRRSSMWDTIARCESTNRWNINTGNGYYGGLQFNLQTWRSVGGTDFAAYPHQATREEQITVANRLYDQRGLQPWGCKP
ncbi:transglycosylase family protein [Tessaracoccus sp. MC1865]|uniref:resuscitation-promoting factor n=1 Tax=unclassified Tessaracoccus TaxID=2635419 RepID=UPI001600CBEE|nr:MULTISPECIES: resuscitation-promoting factor [unclassified Tessaracoccus]MBB1484852.1 transglycosylase family protein [Tessaracoccus sp. MC1865]MBB1510176.1 transglycosylase family protein [Tessaracoccus sp. MC1756]QTO38746.1 transglycosylase family protein [Tessaracoccus sp. MC1865]